MGKIRRVRQKYHTNIEKKQLNKNGKNEERMEEVPNEGDIPTSSVSILPPANLTIPAGLFDGIHIDYDTLTKQKLPEFDKISIKSLRTVPEKHLTKKEKREIRHAAFLKKLDVTKQAIQKERDSKRRAKIPASVFGGMKLLADALPDFETLKEEFTKKERTRKEKLRKCRSIEKLKKREKDAMKNITTFRQVIKHPLFKANGFETILEHVQNMVKIEKDKCKPEKNNIEKNKTKTKK